MYVCIRCSPHSVRFGKLLSCAHKRIVNTMKVYMERKNMQVELILFRKKYCEARNSTRPTCLHLEIRYNISLFDSNHFNYP